MTVWSGLHAICPQHHLILWKMTGSIQSDMSTHQLLFQWAICQNHVSDLRRICCIRDIQKFVKTSIHTFVLVMTCGSPRKKRKIMIESTVSNISMKQSTMYWSNIVFTFFCKLVTCSFFHVYTILCNSKVWNMVLADCLVKRLTCFPHYSLQHKCDSNWCNGIYLFTDSKTGTIIAHQSDIQCIWPYILSNQPT